MPKLVFELSNSQTIEDPNKILWYIFVLYSFRLYSIAFVAIPFFIHPHTVHTKCAAYENDYICFCILMQNKAKFFTQTHTEKMLQLVLLQ